MTQGYEHEPLPLRFVGSPCRGLPMNSARAFRALFLVQSKRAKTEWRCDGSDLAMWRGDVCTRRAHGCIWPFLFEAVRSKSGSFRYDGIFRQKM